MCRLVSVKTNFDTEVKVAEVKKKQIENIIHSATVCNQIHEIVLFGSALEESCTQDSDIDIAIITPQTIASLCKYKSFNDFLDKLYYLDESQNYDKLYFKSMDEIREKTGNTLICRELATKGKSIYRKG